MISRSYAANSGVRQSMGRVGSCFDNAASAAFFSTLEHEVLSRHHFPKRKPARSSPPWPDPVNWTTVDESRHWWVQVAA
jgi:transposase InsO family protein